MRMKFVIEGYYNIPDGMYNKDNEQMTGGAWAALDQADIDKGHTDIEDLLEWNAEYGKPYTIIVSYAPEKPDAE